MFPYSIRDQKGGYSNLDEFSNFIPSFDESPNVGLTLLWIDKLDELFDMEHILMEDQVKFAAYRLKGKTTVWWDRF